MIKRLIIALFVMSAITASALDVNTTAGGLSGAVTDLNITTLRVSGTMNAHDFYFISGNLHRLTALDLGSVKIEGVTATVPYYWCHNFEADVIPVCAFNDMDLESVVLPMSLSGIGRGAFASCKRLTAITLPATLDSIGNYAFAGCESLVSVTLPAQVERVGAGAFMRCTSLTSLTVEPSSRLRSIDATALMDCPSLTTVALGPALQQMGERVLAGTAIQQLDQSGNENLKGIGDWAFVMTPLTAAHLPSSLTDLGSGAFMNLGTLGSVELGGGVAHVSDYTFASTGLNSPIDLTGVATLGNYAMYNDSQLSTVVLPSTLTYLGDRAMAGMTGLTALTSEAEEVPALGDSVWAGVNQQQVPLTVPDAALEQYKASPQWQDFLYGSSWLKGDVNADGEITVADINVIIDIILGRKYNDETMKRADVNGDGEITVADINVIIEFILHPSSAAPARDVNTGDQLHLNDVAMQPGDQRTLIVTLDNAKNYSALQCDITLPMGLSLVEVAAAAGHEGMTGVVDGATTRVVTYSMARRAFDNEQGVALAVTVRADAALAGESEIVLSNVVLGDAADGSWHAADTRARVNNSTGIDDLTATADRVWVEGRTLCIDTRSEGTAHVAAINGTTRAIRLDAGVTRQTLEAGFYVVTLNGKSYKIAIR